MEITRENVIQMNASLKQFQTHLSEFAIKHAVELRDHAFRHQFHEMCSKMNVDGVHLLSDTYTRIAVKIVEVLKRKRYISIEDLCIELKTDLVDINIALKM